MPTPRTISGQALLSGLRPVLKRAFTPTLLAVESEAAEPYRESLHEADALLAALIADPGAPAELRERARELRERIAPLLAEDAPEQP